MSRQVSRSTTREMVREVYELRGQGYSQSQTARITGRPIGTIAKWLAHPETYDPWDDEVAIERALNGDRVCFNALTMFERMTLRERLAERLDREPYDWHNRGGIPFWGGVLADQLGMDAKHLLDTAHAVRYRRRVTA